MSSIEDLIDVPVKKAAKSEKKPKKKRKEEVEAGSGDEAALDKKNKKKRKREEIVLTEEEIAAQKAEKSRKKWKKRDAKVRCEFRTFSSFSPFVPICLSSLCLPAFLHVFARAGEGQIRGAENGESRKPVAIPERGGSAQIVPGGA